MGILMNDVVDNPVPRRGLSKCCCGCSLQTGCIVIGAFSVLNGIITLYVALHTLCYSYGPRPLVTGDDLISSVIMLVYGVLHLVTGLSLIYGADKSRAPLVKFWLYTRYVEFVISVIASIYIVIRMIQHGIVVASILATVTSLAIGIGILAYCIAIVHSFYREITGYNNVQPLKEEI